MSDIKISVEERKALAVPRDAVLRLGDQTVVFVQKGQTPDGKLKFERVPATVDEGEGSKWLPVSHGLECYGVLKAKGVPARLVYFPDENHWVLKPRNSLLWYREVLGWLDRFLK